MIALTPLLKGINMKNKAIIQISEQYTRFNAKFLIKINLKHFTDSFQNENFRTAKTPSSESIEDIMGNSQESNYRYSMNNNMQNQNQMNLQNRKRNRFSFLRDGMLISFHLRKV